MKFLTIIKGLLASERRDCSKNVLIRTKKQATVQSKRVYKTEARTKVCSSTHSSPETAPETEYASSLNIAKRITRNLQHEQTKRIRAQQINHFYQQAADYILDIGILTFTLLAGSFDFKILSFQQEGRGKSWNNLTLFISPTFM